MKHIIPPSVLLARRPSVRLTKGHFHTDAVHLGITALGVAVTFQVIRILAGKLAGSDSQPVSNLGKAVGGLFSFPSGS